MDRPLFRISPLLHMSRLTTAFAAVGNIWFVILWTRGMDSEHVHASRAASQVLQTPVLLALPAGALVAIGLYAFAAMLNDALDVRRDRALHPHRPLASGEVSRESVAVAVAAALILATLGAALLGLPAVQMTMLTGAVILAFNAVGKHVPAVGVVLVGLIYLLQMLVPNLGLRFLWPCVLVLTHAFVVGAVTHVLADRRPRITAPVGAAAVAGWAVCVLILVWMQVSRSGALWPDDVPWEAAAGPAALVVVFVVYVTRKSRSVRDRKRSAEKVWRYGALWMPLYASAWCLGAGLIAGGIVLAALSVVGLLGMTVMRELYSLAEHPVGYRR